MRNEIQPDILRVCTLKLQIRRARIRTQFAAPFDAELMGASEFGNKRNNNPSLAEPIRL
jgi:hypothetical protein